MDHNIHATLEVAKAAPPVTVVGVTLAGISVADWVTYLTLLYIVLQLILLAPKYIKWYKSWRSKQDSCKLD